MRPVKKKLSLFVLSSLTLTLPSRDQNVFRNTRTCTWILALYRVLFFCKITQSSSWLNSNVVTVPRYYVHSWYKFIVRTSFRQLVLRFDLHFFRLTMILTDSTIFVQSLLWCLLSNSVFFYWNCKEGPFPLKLFVTFVTEVSLYSEGRRTSDLGEFSKLRDFSENRSVLFPSALTTIAEGSSHRGNHLCSRCTVFLWLEFSVTKRYFLSWYIPLSPIYFLAPTPKPTTLTTFDCRTQ